MKGKPLHVFLCLFYCIDCVSGLNIRMPPRKCLGRPKGSEAVYRPIAERFRARMKSGSWPVGSVLPSLATLAQQNRVGVRVIRSAIEELRCEGWISSNANRRLMVQAPEGSASFAKGLLVEVLTGSMNGLLGQSGGLMNELHRGIAMGAGELDLPVLTVHAKQLRTALPTDLLSLPIKGIVAVWLYNKELYKSYEKLSVPVVMVDRPEKKWKLHAASVDNFQAAREGTARLIALGHRRIAFVGYIMMWRSEVDPDTEERKRGFFAAFKEAGLKQPREWIFMSSDYDSPESPGMRNLLNAKPPFTAVLATSPGCANLVIQAARSKGLNVPKDLSVTCFQGTQADRPNIAGPRVDFADLARQATHLLDLPRKPARHIRVPAVWHDARTVCPPGVSI